MNFKGSGTMLLSINIIEYKSKYLNRQAIRLSIFTIVITIDIFSYFKGLLIKLGLQVYDDTQRFDFMSYQKSSKTFLKNILDV